MPTTALSVCAARSASAARRRPGSKRQRCRFAGDQGATVWPKANCRPAPRCIDQGLARRRRRCGGRHLRTPRCHTQSKGSEVWGWGTAYGKPTPGGGPPRPRRLKEANHEARFCTVVAERVGLERLLRQAPESDARQELDTPAYTGAAKAFTAAGWTPSATRPVGNTRCARATSARTTTAARSGQGASHVASGWALFFPFW